jgi:hypothetical protein
MCIDLQSIQSSASSNLVMKFLHSNTGGSMWMLEIIHVFYLLSIYNRYNCIFLVPDYDGL